jgi:hypothetical protein
MGTFRKTGQGKLRVTLLLFLADERKLTPFVVLKRENYLKGKLVSRFIFECNELCREIWD